MAGRTFKLSLLPNGDLPLPDGDGGPLRVRPPHLEELGGGAHVQEEEEGQGEDGREEGVQPHVVDAVVVDVAAEGQRLELDAGLGGDNLRGKNNNTEINFKNIARLILFLRLTIPGPCKERGRANSFPRSMRESRWPNDFNSQCA